MKTVAEGIEEGLIPIAEGPGDGAWDPDNPFRNLDAANKEVPEIKDDEKPFDEMTPEEKEIDKIKKEIGAPLDIPPPPATSNVRPETDEIGKAVNTFA